MYICDMDMTKQPNNIIEIPRIEWDKFVTNEDKYFANAENLYGPCACCGRGIKEPKFFINSIFGGNMYPANDTNEYDDAWTMPVGTECVKRIPKEYQIKVGA